MPIYGYDCKTCGEAFELLVRSAETPACPSCASTDLTRQLSRIAAPAKNNGAAPACDGTGACTMCSPGIGE